MGNDFLSMNTYLIINHIPGGLKRVITLDVANPAKEKQTEYIKDYLVDQIIKENQKGQMLWKIKKS